MPLNEPKYQFLIENDVHFDATGVHLLNIQTLWMMFTKTLMIAKVLIVFDNMIADIMTNNKLQAIIKELFIRCRKLNISLVITRQFYFSVPKEARLNLTHYLIMEIHSKRELQNITVNHSADIDYNEFLKIYRNCTNEPSFLNSFLTIDTTLPVDNPMRFRNNFSDSPL